MDTDEYDYQTVLAEVERLKALQHLGTDPAEQSLNSGSSGEDDAESLESEDSLSGRDTELSDDGLDSMSEQSEDCAPADEDNLLLGLGFEGLQDEPDLSEDDPTVEGDASITLQPGEYIVPGTRLAHTFEALEKNRKLQECLRSIMSKVDKLIDRNWKDDRIVREAIEPSNRGRPRSRILPEGQEQLRTSNFWFVNGHYPDPNPDTLQNIELLTQQPGSLERQKWSLVFIQRLKTGVLTEVQTVLTERSLKREYQAPEGLSHEFDRIKGITLDSEEAQKVIASFTIEQWRRVSKSFVKDRSPEECCIYYRNSVARQKPWSLEESAKLTALAKEHKERNWELIAAELGQCRTPAQCLKHYLKYNQPEHVRTRSQWTNADDELLRQLVARYGTKWVTIATEMGGRFDRHQLRDRWHGQTQGKDHRKTGRWARDEDERLQEAVKECGPKWKKVCILVRSRTAQQCRERYMNVLSPELTDQPVTGEEVCSINAMCKEHMRAHGRIIWRLVAQAHPGRTDEGIRRIWKGLKRDGEGYLPPKRAFKRAGMKKVEGSEQQQEMDTEEESAPENIERDVDNALNQGVGVAGQLQLISTSHMAFANKNLEEFILTEPGPSAGPASAACPAVDVLYHSMNPSPTDSYNISVPACTKKKRDTTLVPDGRKGKRGRKS